MTNHAFILKAYSTAWSNSEPENRLKNLKSCWQTTGTYIDQAGNAARGVEEIKARIEEHYANRPDHAVIFQEQRTASEDKTKFHWSMTDGQTVFMRGYDSLEHGVDGRLSHVRRHFERRP